MGPSQHSNNTLTTSQISNLKSPNLQSPISKLQISKSPNLQSPISKSPNLKISKSPNLQSPISKTPKLQNFKTPKLQNSKTPKLHYLSNTKHKQKIQNHNKLPNYTVPYQTIPNHT